jgi:hypothetical protein
MLTMWIEGVVAQLRTTLRGVVLLATAGISAACCGENPGSRPDPGLPALPVKSLVCGPNSLYMLLKLQGRPVTFPQVAQELGSDNMLTSLLELHKSAARLGLSTRIRRCSLEDLGRCTTPFIAHTRTGYFLGDVQIGHYLLVLKVDGDVLQVVDGTTGFVFRTRRSKIARSKLWTGYVLEPTAVQHAWREVITLNGVGLLTLVLVTLLASRWRSRAALAKVAAGLLVAFGWAGGATPATASESSPAARDGLGEWRTGAYDAVNDAANCLYLQLAIDGHPVDYGRVREAVLAKGSAVSMVALREAAGRCGLPMKIVRCGPDGLRRMPKPAIVYMYGRRNGGRFALLYNLNDEQCGLVTGSTVCIQQLGVDDFRRDWSGFALVRDHRDDGWLSAIVGSLILIAGYSGWRLRVAA